MLGIVLKKMSQSISNVLFVPDLKKNLLSLGQLLKKGYEINFKKGVCRIQDSRKGLLPQANMMTNRMFPLYLQNNIHSCLLAKLKDAAWLWHFRYGHLNFCGLRTLQQKNIVFGILKLEHPEEVCEECVICKQHRDQFPRVKTW